MLNIRGIGNQPRKPDRSRKQERKHKSGLIRGESSDATREKDFSQAVSAGAEEIRLQDLQQYITRISEQGECLKRHPNQKEFLKYKALVRGFMRKIVRESMHVRKQKVYKKEREYVTADIVDEQLYELGRYVLLEEEDNLALAATIDRITGLIFDSYELISGGNEP